jgi:hypothetical protein
MSVGNRQHGRLFLEGREVPFSQAVVTANAGQPVQASIDLVPLSAIKNILAGTSVQLFVMDTLAFGDSEYRLVFDGDVAGRGMLKRQDARAFSITALDYSSNFWDAKIYMLNHNYALGMLESIVSKNEIPPEQIVKASAGKRVATTSTSRGQIAQIILADGNKDMAVGAVRVLKQLGNINTFFNSVYDRAKINDRMTVFSGRNVSKFLEDMKMEEFIANFMGAQGGLTSMMDQLAGTMGMVFHNFVSIPFPAKLKKSGGGNRIGNFMFVPDAYLLPPPMCNVLFPNQIEGFGMNEDFRSVPTRYLFNAAQPFLAGNEVREPYTNTQAYPPGFANFMFKERAAADTNPGYFEPAEQMGDYSKVQSGDDKEKAVGGVSSGAVLRSPDYLSGEEQYRGINLVIDNFMPSFTALVRADKDDARSAFIQEIGQYLFFKKRYEQRPTQVQLIFNPHLVPGFNGLFLDDSSAGQSFMAKIDSVSHVIKNDSCTTTVAVSHFRDFDETDALSGNQGEPPTPRWFDPSIFGTKNDSLFEAETDFLKKRLEQAAKKYPSSTLVNILQAELERRKGIKGATVYPNLSQFYNELLGINSVTDATGDAKIYTPRGAVVWLLDQYRRVMNDVEARDSMISKLVRRPMLTMGEAFQVLGATPVGASRSGGKIPPENARFAGDEFDRKGKADAKVVATRRKIVDAYIEQLKRRGHRG